MSKYKKVKISKCEKVKKCKKVKMSKYEKLKLLKSQNCRGKDEGVSRYSFKFMMTKYLQRTAVRDKSMAIQGDRLQSIITASGPSCLLKGAEAER